MGSSTGSFGVAGGAATFELATGALPAGGCACAPLIDSRYALYLGSFARGGVPSGKPPAHTGRLSPMNGPTEAHDPSSRPATTMALTRPNCTRFP